MTPSENTRAELTLDFYNRNAEAFVKDTLSVDMSHLYEKFLPRLSEGGSILDAGCGSGRDALAFSQRGYQVTAFDGSREMARRSTDLTGLEVFPLQFNQIAWCNAFDGVWACASLLHLAADELPRAIERLHRALKTDGLLYASFKKGVGVRSHGGRTFHDFEISTAIKVFDRSGSWKVVETWESKDARPERHEDLWINLVLQKSP